MGAPGAATEQLAQDGETLDIEARRGQKGIAIAFFGLPLTATALSVGG